MISGENPNFGKFVLRRHLPQPTGLNQAKLIARSLDPFADARRFLTEIFFHRNISPLLLSIFVEKKRFKTDWPGLLGGLGSLDCKRICVITYF